MTSTRTNVGLLVGLVCLAVGLQTAIGVIGLGLAATVGVGLLVARPPYAVAYAQVIIAAIATTATPGVILAEFGVLVLLAIRLAERASLRWASGGVLVTLVVAGVGIATRYGDWPLSATAGVVLVAVALILYGVHRYERVTLGLAEVTS